jgi:uncharacterized protein (TIGR00255 family)
MTSAKLSLQLNPYTMLASMTGFGRHSYTFGDASVQIEIRSLNSKMTDARLKTPMRYRDREHDLRKIILDSAERGKIEATISLRSETGADGFAFNRPLFIKYYEAISQTANELGLKSEDILQSIMRIPAITATDDQDLSDDEWQALLNGVQAALVQFHEFRLREGATMQTDIQARAEMIMSLMNDVEPFEVARMEKVRARMTQHLEEWLGKDKVDRNRFEQEVIFYIERLDISEEKLRLKEHCRYFLEQINQKKTSHGRELNFITQEIGREINTLGAKANDADIQRIVIKMKDELEKIKEVVANLV